MLDLVALGYDFGHLRLPSDRAGERYNEVGIIVTRTQVIGSKIDHLVPCFAQMSNHFLLQSESP